MVFDVANGVLHFTWKDLIRRVNVSFGALFTQSLLAASNARKQMGGHHVSASWLSSIPPSSMTAVPAPLSRTRTARPGLLRYLRTNSIAATASSSCFCGVQDSIRAWRDKKLMRTCGAVSFKTLQTKWSRCGELSLMNILLFSPESVLYLSDYKFETYEESSDLFVFCRSEPIPANIIFEPHHHSSIAWSRCFICEQF